MRKLHLAFLLGLFCCLGCEKNYDNTLTVTATAFNSVEAQTSARPHITAWGDTLREGMKAIAVSRDLIPLGLDHGTPVKIEGLPGEYLVIDKMAARWEKRIDIYMAEDQAAAERWGEQEVTIQW